MMSRSLTCSPTGRMPFTPGLFGFFLSCNTEDALKVGSKPFGAEQEQQKAADRIPGIKADGYDRCQAGQKFVTHGYSSKHSMGCDGPVLSGDSDRPVSSRHGVKAVLGTPTTPQKENRFYAKMRQAWAAQDRRRSE